MKLPWTKNDNKKNKSKEQATTTKVKKIRKVKGKLKLYLLAGTIGIYIIIALLIYRIFNK